MSPGCSVSIISRVASSRKTEALFLYLRKTVALTSPSRTLDDGSGRLDIVVAIDDSREYVTIM